MCLDKIQSHSCSTTSSLSLLPLSLTNYTYICNIYVKIAIFFSLSYFNFAKHSHLQLADLYKTSQLSKQEHYVSVTETQRQDWGCLQTHKHVLLYDTHYPAEPRCSLRLDFTPGCAASPSALRVDLGPVGPSLSKSQGFSHFIKVRGAHSTGDKKKSINTC